VNTVINLPWYPRKIVHFSLVLSPSRVYYDFYGLALEKLLRTNALAYSASASVTNEKKVL